MHRYFQIAATAFAAVVATSIVARAGDEPASEVPPPVPAASPVITNGTIGRMPLVNGANFSGGYGTATLEARNWPNGSAPVYMTADNIRQIAEATARETVRSMPASSSSPAQLASNNLEPGMLRSIMTESLRAVAAEIGQVPTASGQAPPVAAATLPPAAADVTVTRVRRAGPVRRLVGAVGEELSLLGRDKTVTYHPRVMQAVQVVPVAAPAAAAAPPPTAAAVVPSAQSPSLTPVRFGLFRR